MTDEELLQTIRGSEKEAHEAFTQVYDTHAAKVYAYCRRILRSDTRSLDDILQNTFVRFYQAVRQGAQVESVFSYLMRTARNLCLNERKRQGFLHDVYNEEEHSRSHYLYPEEQELSVLVNRTIQSLPDDLRECYVLREEAGMEYNEIAQILGISYGSVRTRIWRAKHNIRESLIPYLRDE